MRKTQIKNSTQTLTALLVLFVASTFFAAPALCQDDEWRGSFSDLIEDEDDTGPEYKFSGDFTIEKGTQSGTLNIELDIKKGWHGYSQKQLSGQSPTVFNVSRSEKFRITGPFIPNKKPHAKKNELGDVEEFDGKVTWSAPIELASSTAPEQLVIDVVAQGQVCKLGCMLFQGEQAKVSARFSKYIESVGVFKSEHGSFQGLIDKTSIRSDESANIIFTAKMAPNWHVYKHEPFQRKGTTPQPTIIYFTKTAGFTIGEATASSDPIEHETGMPSEKYSYYHENKVDWTLPITPAKDIKPGDHTLEGVVIFQICTDDGCDFPKNLDFKVTISVGEESVAKSTPISLSVNTQDRDVLMKTSKEFWEDQKSANQEVTALPLNELGLYLGLAFLAGLILNAMPCVLPVIGLKVMSFVQQAGEARGRVFLLNMVFSLGLISVFLVLATLSAFFNVGWGDWLTKNMTGSIIMTAVVFAFGLSMLGVWEIPIPGLSGSTSISKKSEEEGLLGAFFLGVLTTILATPCTGPMLVPAITFTVGQPTWVAYLIFTTMGIGMAMPYILVGIFPSLIGWLPRPGAWMTTFKQITGFILMATVVFLMSSFAGEPRNEYLVAMMSTLLCVAFACWWVGQTSLTAETSEQVKSWGIGLSIVTLGCFISFTYLGPPKYELNWQEFSEARLNELRAENRLVLVDFTGPN